MSKNKVNYKQDLQSVKSYQERQLGVLQDIETALGDSLSASRSLVVSASNIENIISDIANSISGPSAKIKKNTADISVSTEALYVNMSRYNIIVNNTMNYMHNAGNSVKQLAENVDDGGKKVGGALGGLGNVIKNIWKELGGLSGIGKAVDNISTMSNNMLRISGESGSDVRGNRDAINNVVSELNRVTGNAYNLTESYEHIISIAQSVTGDLEAIEEMSRPLLLASKSLPGDMNTIATLFNRFYTRYSFSSSAMEDSLDKIRGNTAGNSASAEETQRHLEQLSYLIEMDSGGNEDKLLKGLNSVTTISAYLQSRNLDPTFYMNMLEDIRSGKAHTNAGYQSILGYAGLDSDSAQQMLMSGQWDIVGEKIIKGFLAMGKNLDIKNTPVGYQIFEEAFGLNYKDAVGVFNAFESASSVQSMEDFMKSNKSNPTMEDVVEDRYVSLTDKIANMLSKYLPFLASIQEALGIGFSDIVMLLAVSKGLFSGGGGGGGTGVAGGMIGKFGKWSSGGFLGKGGGKLAGAAGGKVGAGMMTAGVIAGGALIADGVSGLASSEADTTTKVASGVEVGAGALGIGALLAFGVSNPIGWATLAVGGIAALVKTFHYSSKEMSGNAKATNKAFDDIAKTLRDENRERYVSVRKLATDVTATSDLKEKERLMIESGLFKEEEVRGLNAAALDKLTEAYVKGTEGVSSATDAFIKSMKKEEARTQDKQQDTLIDSMAKKVKAEGVTDSLQQDIAALVYATGDDAYIGRYESFINSNGGKLKKDDALDLLTGGADDRLGRYGNNSRKGGLKSAKIDVATMEAIDFNNKYTTTDYHIFDQNLMTELLTLYSNASTEYNVWRDATVSEVKAVSKSRIEEIFNSIRENPEYMSLINDGSTTMAPYKTNLNTIASALGLAKFAKGINYVPYDQLAYIHEGEAVVPKQYNPAAHTTELEALRAQSKQMSKESQEQNEKSSEYLRATMETVKEIKKVIDLWKNEEAKRAAIQSASSLGRNFVSSMFPQIY